MKYGSVIAVDFDGTIVMHEYPKIGPPVPGAIKMLKDLVEIDCRIILWTMRHDDELKQAVDYVQKNGIFLFGINNNPEQKKWTDSPKAYAQIYIDDAALGCPLVVGKHARPYVNWRSVRRKLMPSAPLKKVKL